MKNQWFTRQNRQEIMRRILLVSGVLAVVYFLLRLFEKLDDRKQGFN